MAVSYTLIIQVVTRLTDAAGYLMCPDATYYISLHTADPVAATPAANELTSAYAYARAAYTNGAAQWNTITGGSTTNANPITFAAASGGDWVTATHFGVWNNSAGTASNFLFGGSLTSGVTCTDGDAVQFQATKLTITCS